jgi:ATP-binding cassette subfamily B protein
MNAPSDCVHYYRITINVSFQYEDGNEKIIEDISLQIAGSQSVAFVGASGIGKTTIGALISRFYDVTKGNILIDGIDIKNIDMESLRENIGIVQQEVYIFNGMIKDNIRVGKLNASDEEIEEAARAC